MSFDQIFGFLNNMVKYNFYTSLPVDLESIASEYHIPFQLIQKI